MRSTRAAAAARPAAIRLWPGWPKTTPVIVVRFPSIQRMARNAKQPPAAAVEPVLTPTNPLCPSSVLVLCTVPATGSVALGVATMLANTGRRMARSTMRTWSLPVDTVASPALLLQLTTNLVHNEIVHNLPEQASVWVTTSVHPKRGLRPERYCAYQREARLP